MPATWIQVVIAFTLAIIALGVAWGHVTTQVSTDHDVLIEIRTDVKELRQEVRDIDRRLIHIEVSTNGYE